MGYYLLKLRQSLLSLEFNQAIILLLVLLLFSTMIYAIFSSVKAKKTIFCITVFFLLIVCFVLFPFLSSNPTFLASINYENLIASFMFVFSLFYISINEVLEELNNREHSLKVSGVFCLVGISILAKDTFCYIAVVFILGTAITSQDFLKTLAAIIFKTKEYFDLEISKLGPNSFKLKTEKEQEIINSSVHEVPKEVSPANAEPANTAYPDTGNELEKEKIKLESFINLKVKMRNSLLKAIEYENKFFKMLSLTSAVRIERNMLIKGKNRSFEVDGMEQNANVIKIYEVKYFANKPNSSLVRRFMDDLEKCVNEIEVSNTQKKAVGELILIGDFPVTFIATLRGLSQYSSSNIQIKVYTTKMIDETLDLFT